MVPERCVQRAWCVRAAMLLGAINVFGCSTNDVLSVPPPAGVTGSGSLHSQAGAESAFNGGKASLYGAVAGFNGLDAWSGMLADEFSWSYFSQAPGYANVDARVTVASGSYFVESGDAPLQALLTSRLALLVAIPLLQAYEPRTKRAKIGEAYALVAYTELLIAEDYCAGVTLSRVLPGGGIEYGMPLTSDSLFAIAESHFDSALRYTVATDSAQGLAAVGLGRTRLDRANYANAAAAVSGVQTAFTYNTELDPTPNQTPAGPNLWATQFGTDFGCGWFNVSDREGQNGLNFVSAGDPRMVVDSTLEMTCDGHAWYYPSQFGLPAPTYVPLATGIEARLIEAEAALHAGQVQRWASALNALRNDPTDTRVTFPPSSTTLPADSTTVASPDMQIDVMFRERAFWLFGTGTRLGDLRREIRQYGRDQASVFPSGSYTNGSGFTPPFPITTYGTDVSLTLPTQVPTTNPHYRGCLDKKA